MIKIFNFEINTVSHCMNRCVACNHFSPIAPIRFTNWQALEADLGHLAQIAHAERFAFVGGEPLLHPQLVRLIGVARQSGIADKIAVTTNGQLLARMPLAFWKQIDLLVVDAYPGKIINRSLANMRAREYGITLQWNEGADMDWYKTMTRTMASPADALALFNRCEYQSKCTTIQGGYLYRCPQSSIIPELFLSFPPTVDGMPIEGMAEKDLRNFLDKPGPLQSCCRCSNNAEFTPWREVAREDWLNESSI